MTSTPRRFYATNAINHHPSCFPSVFDRLALALQKVLDTSATPDALAKAQVAFDEVDWIEPEIDLNTPVPYAYLNLLHAQAMSLGLRNTMVEEYDAIHASA